MTRGTAVQPAVASETTGLYAAFDSIIESDLTLPLLRAADAGVPCLRVRRRAGPRTAAERGDLVHELRDGGGSLVYRLERASTHYLWRYPDVGEFEVAHDGETVWWTAPDSNARDAASALAGPVLGFALQLQGQTGLHGSAVAIDEAAVGLLAPSGYGKSALATALMKRGCELVTDDVLVLRAADDAVLAVPGPSAIKLNPDALERVLEHVGWEELPRHASWLEKRVVRVSETADDRRVARPLAALFVLAPCAPDAAIEITRLHGKDALVALVSSTYNAQLLVREPQLLAGQLDVLRRLAGSASVHVLRCPRSIDRLGEVADAIIAWNRQMLHREGIAR